MVAAISNTLLNRQLINYRIKIIIHILLTLIELLFNDLMFKCLNNV